MAPKKKAAAEQPINIQEVQLVTAVWCVLFTSPLIMHRFPFKAWQELLLPSLRGNRASLESRLKHDPLNEYRSAFYLNTEKKSPALFHIPNGAFHGALASAAIDMPGDVKKAKIERLTKVVDLSIDLYGVPQIFTSMVRNSDMNRTPDVRTRPIFPQAACRVTIRFLKNLTERGITNLLEAAGVFIGVGDWRSERGGPYGAFKVVSEDDREFKAIVKQQGRAAQLKAYEKPTFFDQDTADILTWFDQEVKRREMDGQLARSGDPPHRRVIVEKGGNGRVAGDFVGEEAAGA